MDSNGKTIKPIMLGNLPIFEREFDTNGNLVKTAYKEIKPHLLYVDRSLTPKDATHALTPQVLVDNNYYHLANFMLKNMKIITEELLLNSADINKFDQLIPVYLEKYGSYFYVNKIINFVAGKPTKVELIKL
jgi:hypothetical protein